ncbi:MAG TPA: lysylphosphatidylglycerol synthase domain-containing protein, partial [Pyrinomonadaceae bacterium]
MKDLKPSASNLTRLKILAVFLTLGGAALFIYFISQVGVREILEGIGRVGFGGFLLVFLIYATRLGIRSFAWSFSVEKPYQLKFRDSFQAVIIGEAMSSLIPLGIIVSGTTKGLVVRKKIPLAAGLSALAIENLFYSFATGLFIALGAVLLLLNFNLPDFWYWV